MKIFTYQMKNCRFKEVLMYVACTLGGCILAAGLLVTLFYASVNYTYRDVPPSAEEIAENPRLASYGNH